MTGTLALLAVGFVLIVLLGFLLRRTDSDASPDDQPLLSDEAASPPCLPFEERRRVLFDRIFRSDDWDFVLNHTPEQVQRLFLKERREIASYWLSEIRNRARAAMRIHAARARKSERLQPLLELRLAIDYLLLQIKYEFVSAILRMQGPVALRRMIKQVDGLSDQLGGLLELVAKADSSPSETRVSR